MEQFSIFRTLDTMSQDCCETDLYHSLHQKNIGEFGDRNAYFSYVEELLRRVLAAEKKYKEDKDIEALLREYEFVFIQSKPLLPIGRKVIDIAKYYQFAGHFDKAWNYLNLFVLTGQASLDRVRYAQAMILRNEQIWEYSIELYMCAHMRKRWWSSEGLYSLIKPIAKRIRWDDMVIERLIRIVEKQVISENPSEKALEKEYQAFYTEMTGACLEDLFR